jgi:hypothetical protein
MGIEAAVPEIIKSVEELLSKKQWYAISAIKKMVLNATTPKILTGIFECLKDEKIFAGNMCFLEEIINILLELNFYNFRLFRKDGLVVKVNIADLSKSYM